MASWRRSAVLLGCAAVLGGLAASDVARHESELRDAIGQPVAVVVARRELKSGERLDLKSLGVRDVPARYAPDQRYSSPAALAGLRLATAVAKGADLQRGMVDGGLGAGAPVRPGERVAQLTALGEPDLVVPGVRVDVIVTRDRGGGEARVVLQDAEVLSSRAVTRDDDSTAQRVAVSLRVAARQVPLLAKSEDYAHAVRVVPRAASDRLPVAPNR